GIAQVIRTGRPVIYPELDDPELVAAALGAEHPDLFRELGARAYIAVPLHGRRGVIGAISFVRSRGRYGPEDLALAEGLGQRAGLALENAGLYRAAREAVVVRDEFLAIAAHELRTPLSTLRLQLQSLAGAARSDPSATALHGIDRAIVQTRRL